MGTQHLFMVGGRPPGAAWLTQAAASRRLWAIDKGLELCREHRLRPDFILGDGDSADPAVWAWGKGLGVPMSVYPSAKDFTDTQLALQKLAELPGQNFGIITGAFGGRFDHAFSTVFSAAHAKVFCCLADEREILFFVAAGQKVAFTSANNQARPQVVSLLPLSEVCHQVTADNLRWPLANATLGQRYPNAVSNEMTSRSFSVAVGSGCLGVYLCFGENSKFKI